MDSCDYSTVMLMLDNSTKNTYGITADGMAELFGWRPEYAKEMLDKMVSEGIATLQDNGKYLLKNLKDIPDETTEQPTKTNRLQIDLDDLYDGEFGGTEHDVGGLGHYIIFEPENREGVVEELTVQFKAKVEKLIHPEDVE